MSAIEEIEKRRAARRDAQEKARQAQELVDLEAIDKIEEATGAPLHTMSSNDYKAGVSVKLAFRNPSANEYRRYCDTVGTAHQKGDAPARRKAQELFATACLVYPPVGAERDAMLDAFPGVLISVAVEAAKVAELSAEEEGKA